MARRTDVARVWSTAVYNVALSGNVPTANLPVALDDTATGTALQVQRTRLVRVLGAVNLESTGTGTVGTGAFAALGLVLKNQADTKLYSPFSAADADDPWLFWRAWALPQGDYGASPLNAFFGNLDALWLDIPIRGGRGTNLRHDNGVYLAFSVTGFPAGTTPVLSFNFFARWLLEAGS